MKIKEVSTAHFMELNQGDTFKLETSYFMVVDCIETSNYDTFNAVNLVTGELVYFEDIEEIIVVKGAFVIE